ncbi:MAG: response regulator [Pseudomonadota bacterium]
MATIILLEDDEFLSELYNVHLHEAGYTVVTASNSRGVVELVARHAPVLLITDLVMPDHEGLEGIFKLRRVGQLPILAISANPAFLTMAESLVEATLLKPFSGETLVAIVAGVLRTATRGAAGV